MRFLRGSGNLTKNLIVGLARLSFALLATYGAPSGATVALMPNSLDAFGHRLSPDWALKVPGTLCIYLNNEALQADFPNHSFTPESFADQFGALMASEALLNDIEHPPVPFANEDDTSHWLKVHNFALDQEQSFSILELNDAAGFTTGLMAVEGIGVGEGRRVLDHYAGQRNQSPTRLRTLQSALRQLAYQQGLHAAMSVENRRTLPAASQVAEIYAILRLPFKIKRAGREDWAALVFTQAHLPAMNGRKNAPNPFFSITSTAGTDGLGTTFASDDMEIIYPGLEATFANPEKSVAHRAYLIALGLEESDYRAPRQYVNGFLERLLEPLADKTKLKIKPAEFWAKLRRLLLSPHAEVRNLAVDHLGYMRGPDAADLVADILLGPWPEATEEFLLAASYGLANLSSSFEPARVAKVFEAIWSHPSNSKEYLEIKSQAALALAAYPSDSLAPLATKILLSGRDDWSFMSCAGRYLARVSPDEATRIERRLGTERQFLKRKDERYLATMRARTALLIGLDTPKSVQRIIDLLFTSSHQRRQIPYGTLIEALLSSRQSAGLRYLKWITQYEGEGPLEKSPDILEAFMVDNHIDELAPSGEYEMLFRSAVDELIERFFIYGENEIQPVVLWLSENEHDGREYTAQALWKAFVDNLAGEGQPAELKQAIETDDISNEDITQAIINRIDDLGADDLKHLLSLSKAQGPGREALRRNLEVIALYRQRLHDLPQPPSCEAQATGI